MNMLNFLWELFCGLNIKNMATERILLLLCMTYLTFKYSIRSQKEVTKLPSVLIN
jgi:hypothetical protein